jgi:hypothetical protein
MEAIRMVYAQCISESKNSRQISDPLTIFIVTEEKTLVRYSFSGEQIDSMPVKNTYRRGFSCDAFGMVLYNDRDLAGFSNEGQVVFKMSLPASLVTIDYVDDHLIGATKDNQFFCVNLSSGKPKKGKFLKRAHPFRVVSTRPLSRFCRGP